MRRHGRAAIVAWLGLMPVPLALPLPGGSAGGGHAAAAPVAVAAAAAEGVVGDRIVLRTAGIAIGDVRIRGIHGGRVWFERAGRERGSVPLAAVAEVAFAAVPELAAAERRASAGDRRGAAAMLAPAAATDGPAGAWAARRVIAWLAEDDPSAAIRLAGERLMREGSIQWVARVRASASASAAAGEMSTATAGGGSDVASVRATLRQVRRWRKDLDVVGRGTLAIDSEPEVRRGLAELEDMSERLLAAVRRRGPLPDHAGVARGGPDRAAGDEGFRATAAGGITDAAGVAAALRAGRIGDVLAALAVAGGPDVSRFPPALLAELAAASEAAGRPLVAAAAWLRCGVHHPAAPQASMAWESVARLHESALDDPAAARRIRAHARALADARGESRG
jgi:hypothetical protein